MEQPFRVDYANVDWVDNSIPYAKNFSDTYYSRDGGINESCYIFLEQNKIAERFETSEALTIAEIGFGTGLNFLLCWRALQKSKNKKLKLNYISCEKHPLRKEDLQRALESWPELSHLSAELLRHYHGLIPGFMRFVFEEAQVSLTLLIGDAEEQLAELDTPVDVWFLDGFAPAKNPDLWNENIAAHLTRLSKQGTSLSSFTAASHVRKTLEDSGFKVEKIPGFGHKRESIRAVYQYQNENYSLLPPWKAIPYTKGSRHQRVLIIGGGIAGYTSALALVRRGYTATLLEASHNGFAGPSGNKAGIFTPYIARERSWATDFYLASYRFSLGTIRSLEEQSRMTLLHHTQAKQFTHTQRLETLHRSFAELGIDPEIAIATDIDGSAFINFPNAGWISPVDLCKCIKNLLGSSLAVHHNTTAVALEHNGSFWRIQSEKQTFEAEVVIIAAGTQASHFAQSAWLPLEAVRGEIIYTNANQTSSAINTIQMGKGYLLPANQGLHVIGASYHHGRDDYDSSVKEQKLLLSQAAELDPRIEETTIAANRISFRASTHHRLPYIGPIVNDASFNHHFAELKKGFAANAYQTPEYYPNLYINAGHGSRGLVSSFAAGELLADYISNSTPLFTSSLRGELNPSSYLARKLTKS